MFLGCGLTIPTDGSGDEDVICFKANGAIGPKGLDILKAIRGIEHAKDGRNDYEEAGLEDDVAGVDGEVESTVNLEAIENDEDLLLIE
jgi:hypothetical protein